MGIIKKIDEIIEEKSLLKHEFYQMWSEGKLTRESLAGYSKEYFQLVKAVPSFMAPIIEKSPDGVVPELVENQQEESDHIEPWIAFAGEIGVPEDDLLSYPGSDKTCKAVSDLSELMDTFEGGSCAMYAFEKEIPKISQTKLDGLAQFYGITSNAATEYFNLHTTADIRHTASWRKMIETHIDATDSHKLLETAHRSVDAQNLLLDGCYEQYCC